MRLFKSTYLDIYVDISLLVTGAAEQGSQGTQCALSCVVSCEYLYIRWGYTNTVGVEASQLDI